MWCGKGEFNQDQYKVPTSRREDNQLGEQVAMILNKKAAKASHQLMSARFHTKFGKMTAIRAYAPMSAAMDGEIDTFYK